MASWTALNVAGGDARDSVAQERATEEAQDADNAATYEQALRCQQHQQVEEAKTIYLTLLNGEVAVNSRLEYLCNKNLATMEFEDRQFEEALEYFAAVRHEKALALDATDVVVWYQMATTAVETGKLWLARRTLEEGMKVDSTYWPLVATLVEVLHEIGDYDEYERIAAYIRANDPHCATVRIIGQSMAAQCGDIGGFGDSNLLKSQSSSNLQKKRPKHCARKLKLLNRAQRRLDHLQEIAGDGAKRRKVLQQEMNNKLKSTMQPRQYQLHQASWTNLGKILLEAFEDANRDTRADVLRAVIDIQVNYAVPQTLSTVNEKLCSKDAALKSVTEAQRSSRDDGRHSRPAKRLKHQGTASTSNGIDSHDGASDNDTQDSGAHTSEVDELQPRRRKSRRNEERLREEHAAAIKKAQEKDLAYRLGAFIPKITDEGKQCDSSLESVSLKWLPPLNVELIDDEFRIHNEIKEVISHTRPFAFHAHSDASEDGDSQTEPNSSRNRVSQELRAEVSLQKCVTSEQIAAFVVQYSSTHPQHIGVLDWVRRYLNQCGKWADMKLGGDDEDIYQVFAWLEKVLNEELDTSKTFVTKQRNIIDVASHSLVQGSRFKGNGLTVGAQLFLLELHFDMLLQKPVRGKRRRKLRRQIEEQAAQAQRLLFEFSWLEESDEMDTSPQPTQCEFIRLLWLLARMYERSGNPQLAQNYYIKCRDKLYNLAEENDAGADGDCYINGDIRVSLPNQKADSEITLRILDEKVSGLRFSDVCSEAQCLFSAGAYEHVVSLLLGHFFPANQAPRMIDFLSEFEVDEDGSQTQNDDKKLFEMVLKCLGHSSEFCDDDIFLLLLTTLYHVVTFIDGLSVEYESSARQDHPDEACANALAALKFLLMQLTETCCDTITSGEYRLLVCALCMKCLEPSILLRFECPSTVFSMIRDLLEAVKIDDKHKMTVVEAMARLFYTIRSLSSEDFRDLFSIVQHPVKRRQPRRDRVRVVLVDLLRYLNLMFRDAEELASSFPLLKRSALMAVCCAMMKDEEETVARSDGKTAKQLFGNGAILFVLLYESFHRPSTSIVPTELVDLIHLLHERLGQHGICGLTFFGGAASNTHVGSCFLESCILLLSKFVKRMSRNVDSRDGSKSPNGSASDDTEENEAEEEAEAGDLLKKEICQCYRCMYDVQILPGCEDHKTGNTFASLQNADQLSKHADAMRLAHFAIPILLDTKPKNNGQKKERLKLLHAVRDALSDSGFAAISAQPPAVSPSLIAYLSPRGLLQWEDALPYPFDGSSTNEVSADEACLSHLWYLLGANFILGRVKRRGNLSELLEMEQQVKERVEFLTKDVLYYHPDRIDSWIRLGKTMKELYHAATDAFAAVLGRKLRVQALLGYTSKGSVRNPEQPAQQESEGYNDYDVLSFKNVVLSWNLFGKMKEWQNHQTGGHGTSGKPPVNSKEDSKKDTNQDHSPQSKVPIEEFATVYIAQVIEFSRRCFSMGACLGEVAAQEQELKLELQSKSDNDVDDSFNEELESFRNTVIECNEDCGLLLFNVLQEFSLMKEENPAQFPVLAYSRVTEQALAYFRKGLEICEANDDANEVRFRLLHMIGKTLKKIRWCQLRKREVSDPEDLTTAIEMADCFSKAEEAREEGDMEHALVHAFYALQALRAELVTVEAPSVAALRLVCDHFYEEEEEGEEEKEEEEEEEEDEDGNNKTDTTTTEDSDKKRANKKPSSKPATGTEDASSSTTTPDDSSPAITTKRDEILALLADTESDEFTQEVKVTVARGYLALNIIDALESIPDEDRYFHPSRYVLARIVYWLSNFYNVLAQCGYKDDIISALIEAVETRRSQLKIDGPSDAADRAIKEMAPLFDKRRPQVVAIWFTEYIPTAKKFEELNQRQMKFDYYRLKYWRFYVNMLQENMAYGRLKEIGTWVLACKEEHDVIPIMLGIVLKARGKVLRARLQRFMNIAESKPVPVSEPTNAMRTHLPMLSQLPRDDQHGAEAILKHLAKAYSYYLEVSDAQTRLKQVMEDSSLLLENAELPMVAVFFMGVTAYPSQMPLLEKDVALVDRDFQSNVVVIKNALRRDELPPRIFDAEGREAWKTYLEAACSFCEDKWPERSGKGKASKGRSRTKATAVSTSTSTSAAGGASDASQSAPDVSSQ